MHSNSFVGASAAGDALGESVGSTGFAVVSSGAAAVGFDVLRL